MRRMGTDHHTKGLYQIGLGRRRMRLLLQFSMLIVIPRSDQSSVHYHRRRCIIISVLIVKVWCLREEQMRVLNEVGARRGRQRLCLLLLYKVSVAGSRVRWFGDQGGVRAMPRGLGLCGGRLIQANNGGCAGSILMMEMVIETGKGVVVNDSMGGVCVGKKGWWSGNFLLGIILLVGVINSRKAIFFHLLDDLLSCLLLRLG